MITRILISAALALGFSSNLWAYGDAGCGLGSLVMTKNTIVSQILAMTTNGTSWSQTLGITSGTSGCKRSGIVMNDQAQTHFVAANFQTLKEDMAKGAGESVVGLGALMGCPQSHLATFGSFMQSHYDSIVPTDATPDQVLENIHSALGADEVLGAACVSA